jgi:hypothetical protein
MALTLMIDLRVAGGLAVDALDLRPGVPLGTLTEQPLAGRLASELDKWVFVSLWWGWRGHRIGGSSLYRLRLCDEA